MELMRGKPTDVVEPQRRPSLEKANPRHASQVGRALVIEDIPLERGKDRRGHAWGPARGCPAPRSLHGGCIHCLQE
eukprot:15450201-Alexandrium_andersonii.AAC.1